MSRNLCQLSAALGEMVICNVTNVKFALEPWRNETNCVFFTKSRVCPGAEEALLGLTSS